MFWRVPAILLALWGVATTGYAQAPEATEKNMIQRFLDSLEATNQESLQDSFNGVADAVLPSAEGEQIPIYKLAPKLFPSLRMVPLPPVDTNASCEEMYMEVTQLLELARRRHPSFYNDPRNQAVFISAALFPSTVYFWGYTAVEGHFDGKRTAMVKDRIKVLRGALADRQCFVR
jgi:hypothetical protein